MGPQFFLHFLNTRRVDLPDVQKLLGDHHIPDRDKVPFGVFTFDVLDKFSEYMSTCARHGCSDDPTKPFLSGQTVDNYFSAVKTYYTVHHSDYKKLRESSCFEQVKWAVLRGGLVKSTKNRAAAAGVALSTPRETLSDDDFQIMALLCLSIGNLRYFMFLAFQCLLFQVGGRGAESATRKFGHISTRNHVADGIKTNILTVFIQRDKNLRCQTCTIFPQADILLWWKDLSFLLAILIILNCNSQRAVGKDDPIFPEFHEQAAKDLKREVGGRNQKKGAVSDLFNRIYKEIYGIYENSGETFHGKTNSVLNPKIGSHSAKKLTCQHLSDYGNNPISTIFRVGWDLRSLHTLFDYIVGSKVLDDQAGRTLSGWYNVSHGSEDSGGLPPLIDDAIVGLPDEEYKKQRIEILSLGGTLFAGCSLDTNVQMLLLGALFKHWDSMIDCYEDDCNQHPVVHAMNNALCLHKISQSMFSKWCKNTEINFKLKNLQGLPVRQIQDLPDEALIDVRTFRHFIEYYKQSMSQMIRETTYMKHAFVTLKNEMKEHQQSLQTQPDNKSEDDNGDMAREESISSISTSTTKENDQQLLPDIGIPGTQMSFTSWFDRCRLKKNSIEVFIHYHTFDLERGHEVDLIQQKQKISTVAADDDQKRNIVLAENKKYNNFYYKCKKAVCEMRILLGTLDPCPVDVVERQKWESCITNKLMEIFSDRLGKDKIAPLNAIVSWHSERKKQLALS
jgi:hypothetical protein